MAGTDVVPRGREVEGPFVGGKGPGRFLRPQMDPVSPPVSSVRIDSESSCGGPSGRYALSLQLACSRCANSLNQWGQTCQRLSPACSGPRQLCLKIASFSEMVFPCKERELEVTLHSLQAQRIKKPMAAHWTRPDDLNIRISRQGPIGNYTYPGDIFFNGSTAPKMLVWIEGLLTASWGVGRSLPLLVPSLANLHDNVR